MKPPESEPEVLKEEQRWKNTPSEPNLILRTAKVWQSRHHELIFQASPWGPLAKTLATRKLFFYCDVKQSSFATKVLDEKPSFEADTSNPLITLLRKNCKGATIAEVFKDTSNGDLWIPLYRNRQEEKPWCLWMNKSRPPNFALVSPDDSIIVRHGMKGTFTKRRQLEARPQLEDSSRYKPLLANLITAIKPATLDQVSEDKSPDATSATRSSGDQEQDARQKILLAKLKRRLKTAKKAREKQSSKIPTAQEVNYQNQRAAWLQTYAYLVKEGDLCLQLEPTLTGLEDTISIELDPEKSLGANLEEQFKLAKKLNKGRRLGLQLEESQSKDLANLEAAIAELQASALSLDQIFQIANRFKIPLEPREAKSKSGSIQPKSHEASTAFRSFRASTGDLILVGKGPRENDELTKSAKASDLWLHAAGVAGSHVIVPIKGALKQAIPPQLLKEAAILALHFSKFKDDHAGETYVAKRSQIKKQKGMPPGLWNVERCKTMFFRYTIEELQEILDRKSF